MIEKQRHDDFESHDLLKLKTLTPTGDSNSCVFQTSGRVALRAKFVYLHLYRLMIESLR